MPNINSTKDGECNIPEPPIFMFDLPSVLSFTNARRIEEDHPEFIKMKEYIKQTKGQNVKNKRKFIAIFNDKFDFIRIYDCYKRCYPSLNGCKIAEFEFTSPFMSSHSQMIANYISKIQSKTEVNLFIGK